MKFGLSNEQYDFIVEKVVNPLQAHDASVWCFGSRARGDHSSFSDIDLLIECNKNIASIVSRIEEELIESSFPFKVDLVMSTNLADSYRSSVEVDKVLFCGSK